MHPMELLVDRFFSLSSGFYDVIQAMVKKEERLLDASENKREKGRNENDRERERKRVKNRSIRSL